MLRLHALVYGRVQGVGFRYFVQKNAIKLGVRGWVRNNEDGSVEVLAYGESPEILRLLDLLKQGPTMSYVTEVKHEIENVSECPFNTFFIRF